MTSTPHNTNTELSSFSLVAASPVLLLQATKLSVQRKQWIL